MMPLSMPAFTRISCKQNPALPRKDNMKAEHDLSGFVCPLSKMKATELINNLAEGETIELILGDTDSLKSVAQELKARGIRPDFKQDGDNRFLLTITK